MHFIKKSEKNSSATKNTLFQHKAKKSVLALLTVATALLVSSPASMAAEAPVHAIGIENQYADVIKQIGGKYVDVTSIVSDPNTNPHTFEASPSIARQIAKATLIVENGADYDDWADKLIAASPDAARKVINVHALLKLPKNTENPHLWYDPKTMPAVADAVAEQLAIQLPAHAAEFHKNAETFHQSMQPVIEAINAFKADFPNTPVAVTEPVGDYLLEALGAKILTPKALEYNIMNDVDPAPQLVSEQNALLSGKKVQAFLYNQQVTDPITDHFLSLARKHHVPVVGVYETMPEPGFHYQSWMLAEVKALRKALTNKTSTESLIAGQ